MRGPKEQQLFLEGQFVYRTDEKKQVIIQGYGAIQQGNKDREHPPHAEMEKEILLKEEPEDSGLVLLLAFLSEGLLEDDTVMMV